MPVKVDGCVTLSYILEQVDMRGRISVFCTHDYSNSYLHPIIYFGIGSY
jgi:hypothetical protein